MDKEKLKRLRYKAKTDLYWLATEILDNQDFIERVHRPVCEFFIKKKPGKSIAEQDTQKERLLLDPRGHFKTTIDEADIVQWILVDPNVRILIMSGKLEVAEAMLRNVKGHFQNNDKLRKLFPELCPPQGKEFGNLSEFTCPARTKQLKEPTVLIAAGESVKAGYHFDIIKGDDIVNEINSATKDQITKTIRLWNYVTPLVEPYGYRDLIGTRYDDSDLYGWAIENKRNLKVFLRACWTLKPEYEHLKNDNHPLKDEMVDLLFPERFTFEWFNEQRSLDPYIFNCQYLNDPIPTDTATFTDDLLTRHTIPHIHIPKSGSVFQAWDIGFTQKSYSDWSVGICGLYDTHGNLFILDIMMGKFSPYELVTQIVSFAMKWRPLRIGIEEAGGSRLMLPALDMLQRQLHRRFNFDWLPTSPLKKKTERIASLQPLLKQDKIYFSASLRPDFWAEVKKQFIKFPKFVHDDGPDAISMLLNYRTSVDVQTSNSDANPEDEIDSVMFDPTEDNLLGAGLTG